MKAIFPGTFDPPTLGHLDIAKRALTICEHLVIAVGINPKKNSSLFSLEERVLLWKQILQDSRIEILSFENLIVDFARAHKASVLIRAARSYFDFEQELVYAHTNRLFSGMETIFLPVDEKYRLISSSLIKEVAEFGMRLDAFIPKEIEPQVFQKIQNKNY